MEPLRPYQVVGAQWLASIRYGLLADVPRIGKTAQAITACDMTNSRHVLVICPAIARLNWQAEFLKFSKNAREWDVVLSKTAPPRSADGMICSYDLTLHPGIGTKLLSRTWDCLILDESHYLGNYESKRSQFIWGKLVHKARRVWCLTGTPIRNHAGQAWPMLRVFGVYGKNYESFLNEFMVMRHTPYGAKPVGLKPERLAELQGMLKKIMLRRRLEDVLTELPRIEFSDWIVEPSPVDLRRWYPEVMLQLAQEDDVLRQIAEELRATETLIEFTGDYAETTINNLKGLQGPKTDKSRRYVGLQKAPSVARVVSEELAQGYYEKIVLFAWHRDVVECLRFSLRDWFPVVLFGGTTVKNRERAIREFNKNPKVRVIICNIAAAAVNINLSVTNEVGIVEASYEPTDNAQAVMRVYCFGQTKPVNVRFFNLAHSVDERVHAILRRKTRNLVSLLDDGKPTVDVINPFAE